MQNKKEQGLSFQRGKPRMALTEENQFCGVPHSHVRNLK